MKIIHGKRGSGKTTKLIEIADNYNGYIVAHDHNMCDLIWSIAQESGKIINFPITYDEFIKKEYHAKRIKCFHIDNADMLLQKLSNVPINTIAITTEVQDEIIPSKDLIISNRLAYLQNLNHNWDGYGGFAPSEFILQNVISFIAVLDLRYKYVLDAESIFPNPNGTITVEWRDGNNVVSVEFGETSSSFYSVINDKEISKNNIENTFSPLHLLMLLSPLLRKLFPIKKHKYE